MMSVPFRFILGLAAMAFLSLTASSPALILSGTTGNTTSSGAGAGWDYTGRLTNGSGVYLGSYGGASWVLTAYHVGQSDLTINGVTYSQVANSSIRITNEDGSPTDLIVFRISTDPGLPNLTLGAAANNAPVTMIGSGYTGESQVTNWQTSGTSPNIVWTETPTGGNRHGYKYATPGNRQMRWGTNTVDAGTSVTNAGYGVTHLRNTTFNNALGDAQVSTGDSGGGVFDANGNLVGIMVYQNTFEDQPSDTAVYGDQSSFADMDYYGERILAAVPEPSALMLGIPAILIVLMAIRRQRRSA